MFLMYEVKFYSGIFLTELILIAITVFRRSSFCHVNNHLENACDSQILFACLNSTSVMLCCRPPSVITHHSSLITQSSTYQKRSHYTTQCSIKEQITIKNRPNYVTTSNTDDSRFYHFYFHRT